MIDPAENTAPPDGVSKTTISAPPSSGLRPRASRWTFFGEDGELWSRNGLLLAQSRQLAMAMPLPGAP